MKHSLPVLLTVLLPTLLALTACNADELGPSLSASPAQQDTDDDPTAPGFGLPEMERPDSYSDAKVALGKKLFFDERLSSDGSMSCRSCHKHELGWTDGQRFSRKVNGELNTRNSPSLYNVGYQPYFYWDGRAPTLEKNVEAAWKGHMGGDPEAMAKKLAEIPAYESEFEKAFDGKGPSGDRMVEALAHFVRSLQAGGTAFDEYMKGDKSAISEDAQKGFLLFVGKAGCATCHTPHLYTNFNFHNVGIGSQDEEPDVGRGKIDEKKIGAFKVPSLRAIELTAPYFHNGSVGELREAVELMASGGIDNPHKDPLILDRTLDEAEIDQLVAFLKSLTPRHEFEEPKLP